MCVSEIGSSLTNLESIRLRTIQKLEYGIQDVEVGNELAAGGFATGQRPGNLPQPAWEQLQPRSEINPAGSNLRRANAVIFHDDLLHPTLHSSVVLHPLGNPNRLRGFLELSEERACNVCQPIDS